MKPEHHSIEKQTLHGTPVTITTYCLGDQWHCTIANADPGANIARADGPSREEAINSAMIKASKRLGGT
jgi:hypothetical protein